MRRNLKWKKKIFHSIITILFFHFEKTLLASTDLNCQSAIIVVTVDGKIYSFDPWTGSSQGLFTSGGPLVSTSTKIGRFDGLKGEFVSQELFDNKYVIPGLDGKIYTIDEEGKTEVIPVTAPELVFDPIMSCIAEGCSLLVGEKRTKIFALRTGSGVIDWVLDNGKVMSADLDKELKDSETLRSNRVLLQRDDYLIRALNTINGKEHWNVTLAHFKALDMHQLQRTKPLGNQAEISHPMSGQVKCEQTNEEKPGLLTHGQESSVQCTQGTNKPPAMEPKCWPQQLPIVVWHSDYRLVGTDSRSGHQLWETNLDSLPIQFYGVVGDDLVDIEAMPAPEAAITGPILTDNQSSVKLGNVFADRALLSSVSEGYRSSGAHVKLLPFMSSSSLKLGVVDGNLFVFPSDHEEVLMLGMSEDQAMLGPPPQRVVVENYLQSPELHEQAEWMKSIAGHEQKAQYNVPRIAAPGPTERGSKKGGLNPPLLRNKTLPKKDSNAQAFYVTPAFVITLAAGFLTACVVVGVAAFRLGSGRNKKPKYAEDLPGSPVLSSLRGNTEAEGQIITKSVSEPAYLSRLPCQKPKSTGAQFLETHFMLAPAMRSKTPSPIRSTDRQFFGTNQVYADMEVPIEGPESPLKLKKVTPTYPLCFPEPFPCDPEFTVEGYSEKKIASVHLQGGLKGTDRSQLIKGKTALQTQEDTSSSGESHSAQIKGLAQVGMVTRTSELDLATPRLIETTTRKKASVNDKCAGSPLDNSSHTHYSERSSIKMSFGQTVVSASRYAQEFDECSDVFGRGGFGRVHRATNKLDGHVYAIKKIRLSRHPAWKDNFDKVLREVKILALLDHVNIVRYHQAWIEEIKTTDNPDDIPKGLTGAESSSYFDSVSTNFVCRSSQVAGTQLPRCKLGKGGGKKNLLGPSTGAHGKRRLKHGFKSDGITCVSDSEIGGLNEWEGEDSENNVQSDVDYACDSGFNRFHSNKSSFSELSASEDGSYCVFQEKQKRGRAYTDVNFTQSNAQKTPKMRSDRCFTMPDWDAVNLPNWGEDDEDQGGLIFEKSDVSDSAENSWSTTKENRQKAKSLRIDTDSSIRRCRATQKHKPVTFDVVLYIQMQLCEEKTLATYLLQNPRSLSQSLEYFLQVTQGLKYVHECKLIHRDLKPSNCFLFNNSVKIGDFGLSRQTDELNGQAPRYQASGSTQLFSITTPMSSAATSMNDFSTGIETNQEEVTQGIGTALYASPEQMNGSVYDEKTDIYSLGIILFELCHPPFITMMERVTSISTLRQQRIPLSWPSDPTYSQLAPLIISMLSPHPKERPTAAEIVSKMTIIMGKDTILSVKPKDLSPDNAFLRVEGTKESTQGVHDQIVELVKKLIEEEGRGGTLEQYIFHQNNDNTSTMELLVNKVDDETLSKIVNAILNDIQGVKARRVFKTC